MRWWALVPFVVAACARSEPPVAPVVALDVPPMSDAGAPAPAPPPNPEKYVANDDPPANEPEPTGPQSLQDAMGPNWSLKPSPPSGNVFDRGKAAAALGSVQLGRCALPGGPNGPGHVTITFDPSGRVSMANVDQGTFPGTPTGACIAKVYSTVKVPPFQGTPVRVGKSFVLP